MNWLIVAQMEHSISLCSSEDEQCTLGNDSDLGQIDAVVEIHLLCISFQFCRMYEHATRFMTLAHEKNVNN